MATYYNLRFNLVFIFSNKTVTRVSSYRPKRVQFWSLKLQHVTSGYRSCRGLFRASCTYDLPTGSPIKCEEASLFRNVQRLVCMIYCSFHQRPV